ncbi:MAG TPA: hypothetical protein VKB84_06715 [Candidatus Binataceae bacterium]|nr:hypothetical protein [Candidatus Binataceae bacterium]
MPPRPDPPGDAVKITLLMVSECMAISDRWGMGIMNLGWLVDPPGLDLHARPLREWTISASDLAGIGQIDLTAIGPNGERALPALTVTHGAVFGQAITDADETLQLKTRGPVTVPPPDIAQRWIVPWTSVPAAPGVTPLAFLDGVLYVADRDGIGVIELPGQPAVSAAREPELHTMRRRDIGQLPAPLGARLRRGMERGRDSGPRTVGVGRSVAVVHRDTIVLGFAGPLISIGRAEVEAESGPAATAVEVLREKLRRGS